MLSFPLAFHLFICLCWFVTITLWCLCALDVWKPPTESPAFSYGDSQRGRDLYPSHNFSTTAKANSLGFSGNSLLSSVSPNSMYWPNRVESVTDSFVPVINKDSGERKQSTGNGYRLFGIQLVDNSNVEETSPLAVASGMGDDCPIVSLDAESDHNSEPSNINRSEIPSISCEPEKSCLRSPQESQSRQIRSCTKVIACILLLNSCEYYGRIFNISLAVLFVLQISPTSYRCS